MRSAVLVAALAGAAMAKPFKRQDADFLDFDLIDADQPAPPAVVPSGANDADIDSGDDAAAVVAAVASGATDTSSKRGLVRRETKPDCSAEDLGSGPTITSPDDSPASFLAAKIFNSTSAGAPAGTYYYPSFGPQQGSTQISTDFLDGWYTMDSFDTQDCQASCDSRPECKAVNMYFERDPTIKPGPACINPPSTTVIKCVRYKTPIFGASATNAGQYRGNGPGVFHVVIAGSMGYNKVDQTPAQIPGWQSTPMEGSINAPDNSYVGAKWYSGAYNPQQCADAVARTNAYNQAHPPAGGYKPITFFNSYVLSKNNAAQGTYCGLYTSAWDATYATNFGQWRGSDRYSVSQSYGWTVAAS